MQKLFFTLIFGFLFVSVLCADELADGYTSFEHNNLTGAYTHFLAATHVDSTRSEAYLMLSLLSTIDKGNDTAFQYFLDFYKYTANPQPYIMALFHHKAVLGYNAHKSKIQLAWLMQLLKRPDLDPTLRASIYEDLGNYYESLHDMKKSRAYFAKIGAITQWQIAGDFDNISASGFDKNFAPVTHPEPGAVFKNKLNADVQWFDLYKQVPGKWIDFTDNFYCNNTLVFAQTFCNSPETRTVYLRIGTSGSLKVWVNDQNLFSEPEERNNGLDTYVIPVKIEKGNNRILLQIGCSRIDRCNFLMRVTDTKGDFLPDLHFSKVYTSYAKTRQALHKPVEAPDELYFSDQIRMHPSKMVNYLILANAYLSNDKIHLAKHILDKAQKIAPDCGFILNQLTELYFRDKNRTSASLTQEKLKQVDPDNPEALNYFINNAFDSKNYDDARKYIEKKEKLYGGSKDLYVYKLKLASAENNPEEYTHLINTVYSKYSDDYNFVYDKFQFERDYLKNQKAAVRLLKNFTRNYLNTSALQTLSAEYIDMGQTKDGVDILKKLSDWFPYNDYYYKKLGLYYLQAGNPALAEKYIRECLEIAPYYGPYHGYYARVLMALGQKDKAEAEYRLNILYKPDDYEAIRKLRNLEGQKDVFDYFPKEDYYKTFKNSPTAADYPNDNFISLADNRQVVLYENGGCETRHIMLLKALTLKGIDNLKEYQITYNSNEHFTIEKAEVLKKNGNRLQAEVHGNQIVYTSLEPGDAVYLIYRKSRIVSDVMSKQFDEKWLMNNWYPVLDVQYNLLVAKDVKFRYKTDHFQLTPEKSQVDGFTMYSWKKSSKNEIQVESNMPPLVDVGEVLSISTLPSWTYVSNWYYDVSNTKTKPDYLIENTVHRLLKGKEKDSQMEKAKIIYNYVEENIRYSSVAFRQSGIVPQKASDVLVTRIGDCKDLAVLFTSMCKVAGIKAGVVLVITRQNGDSWMEMPSFDFDHAIARASLDGKEYYIEMTSNYLPFAAMGESLLNAVVLNVKKEGSGPIHAILLNPSTRQANNLIREAHVSFRGDSMINSVSTQRTGAMSAYIRYYYRDLGKEDREKRFTKSITDSYSNTKLLSLNFGPSLADCSDTVSYSYSYIAPKVFSNIDKLSIVKLPLTDKLSPMDFLSINDRKFPVETWSYSLGDTVSEKMVIVFPDHKKLADVPKSVHYACKQADYTLNFKEQGNELHVFRQIVYKKDSVPVKEYAAYQKFMNAVVNADNQQIGFR